MKARLVLFALAVLVSRCDDESPVDERDSCSIDTDCPFQQCCVERVCVDPGLIGVCASSTSGNSSIVADKTTAQVGTELINVTATLRDAYGRPQAGRAVSISVTSACFGEATCNVLEPTSGTTDAAGHFTTRLTSTVAEPKHVTLLADDAPIATTDVAFVPGDPVGIGFRRGGLNHVLGQSLGEVGMVDSYGNFTAFASPQPQATLVTVALDPNAAGIVLTDANGSPSASEPYDVTHGPVTMSRDFVPIAAHQLVVRATSNVFPPISATFDVTVPSVTAPPVASVADGATVALAWATTPLEAPALLSLRGTLVADTSPATVIASFLDSSVLPYEVAIADSRPSSLRTIALSEQRQVFAGDDDVRIRRIVPMGNGDVVIAGETNDTVTLGVRQGVPVVIEATSLLGAETTVFVARLDRQLTEVVWSASIRSNAGSEVRGLAALGDDVVVAANYGGLSGLVWQSTPSTQPPVSCALSNPNYPRRAATVARFRPDGDIAWCRSVNSYGEDNNNSTYVGAVLVRGTTTYVGIHAVSLIQLQTDDTERVPMNFGASGPRLFLVPYDDHGTYDSSKSARTAYRFVTHELGVGPATDDVLVFGTATADDDKVINGSTLEISTTQDDATVIAVRNGAAQWFWASGAAQDDQALGGWSTENGDVAIAGTFASEWPSTALVSGSDDVFIAALNPSHEVAWASSVVSTTAIGSVQVTGDVHAIAVAVDGGSSLTIPGSVAAVVASGQKVALATAWRWSGQPFWSVPSVGMETAVVQLVGDGSAWLIGNSASAAAATLAPLDATPMTLANTETTSAALVVHAQLVDVATIDVARQR